MEEKTIPTGQQIEDKALTILAACVYLDCVGEKSGDKTTFSADFIELLKLIDYCAEKKLYKTRDNTIKSLLRFFG